MNKNELFMRVCRTDYRTFVGFAFRELHPGQVLVGNWHIDLIADRLAGIVAGRTQRLIINTPPRSLKSLCASIALPAFILGSDPTKQIMLIAGHQKLSTEMMAKIRRLMSSERYRAMFPHMRLKMTASSVQTAHGGFVKAAIVGHPQSGRGADFIIVDDPLSPHLAKDETVRTEVNDWFDAEVLMRLNNRSSGALLIVMQRVHPKDLTSHLRSTSHGFETLCLESIALRDQEWTLSNGTTLRRETGDVIDATREDREEQIKRLYEIGGFNFGMQYLQGAFIRDEREYRYEWKWEKLPPDWTPYSDFSRRGGMIRFTTIGDILERAFGIRPDGPEWVSSHGLTDEQWEIMARRHHEKLMALHAADTPSQTITHQV